MAMDNIPRLEELSMEELLEGFTEKFHAFGKILQCPICLSLLSNTAMTKCAHAFCRKCFTRSLKDRDASCPLCKKAVSRREARGHANVDALVKIYKSVFRNPSPKPGDEYSQVASISQIQQSLAPGSNPHESPINVEPSQGFKFQFDLDEIDTPVQPAAKKQRKSGVTLTTPMSMLSTTSKNLPGSTSTLATVIVSRTPGTHLNQNRRTPATELVSRTPATVLVRKPEENRSAGVGLQAKPPRASSNILTPKVQELGQTNVNVPTTSSSLKQCSNGCLREGVGGADILAKNDESRVTQRCQGEQKCSDNVNSGIVAEEQRSELNVNLSVCTADLPETQVSHVDVSCREKASTGEGGQAQETDAAQATHDRQKQPSSNDEVEATLPMEHSVEATKECNEQQSCTDDVAATLPMDLESKAEGDANTSEKEEVFDCEAEEVIECTVNEVNDVAGNSGKAGGDENVMNAVIPGNGTQDEEIPSSLPDEEERTTTEEKRELGSSETKSKPDRASLSRTMETTGGPNIEGAIRATVPLSGVISESPVAVTRGKIPAQPESKDDDCEISAVEATLQDPPESAVASSSAQTLNDTPEPMVAGPSVQNSAGEGAIESTVQPFAQDKALAQSVPVDTTNSKETCAKTQRPVRKATPRKPSKPQDNIGTLGADKIVGSKLQALKNASGPQETQKQTSSSFKFKDKVTVARRMGPGQNKPGGMALIYSVNQDGTYDVKYVLGGSERHVAVEHLRHGHHVDDESVCGRATNKRKRRPVASTQSSITMPKAKVAKRAISKATKAKRTKKENRERNVASKGKKQAAVLPVIVFTGVKDAKNKYHASIKRMKGQPASGSAAEFKKVTHVVTGPKTKQGIVMNRTMKYFLALASGCWIVDQNWLTQSLDKGVWQDESSFEVRGDSKTKSKGTGGPSRAREARLKGAPLLSGYKVYLAGSFNATPSHPCLPKGEIENLLFLCGASLLQPSQLGSLKKDKAISVIVLSKDSRSMKQDTHSKQVAKLVSSGVITSVNNAWLLDSLCLYEIQDVKDPQYVVKT